LPKTNQKGSRSLGQPLADCPALLARNGRRRKVAIAPPSRFSVPGSAARLREMANTQKKLTGFFGSHSVPLSIEAVAGNRREGKQRLRLFEPPQVVSF